MSYEPFVSGKHTAPSERDTLGIEDGIIFITIRRMPHLKRLLRSRGVPYNAAGKVIAA